MCCDTIVGGAGAFCSASMSSASASRRLPFQSQGTDHISSARCWRRSHTLTCLVVLHDVMISYLLDWDQDTFDMCRPGSLSICVGCACWNRRMSLHGPTRPASQEYMIFGCCGLKETSAMANLCAATSKSGSSALLRQSYSNSELDLVPRARSDGSSGFQESAVQLSGCETDAQASSPFRVSSQPALTTCCAPAHACHVPHKSAISVPCLVVTPASCW